MNLLKHITLFILIISINSVFSQKEKLNKHNFSFKDNAYYFFDGATIAETNVFNQIHYGIEYQRRSTSKRYWSYTIDHVYYRNLTPVLGKKSGDIWYRNFIDIRANYDYSFLEKKKHQLFWKNGVSLRIGSELVFGGYYYKNQYFAESFVLSKNLVDFGISTGLQYNYYIGKHFNLNSEFSYTLYAYTYDKKDPNYEWDTNSPTWNVLYFSLGVGFNYGE